MTEPRDPRSAAQQAREAQRERAHQSWELAVELDARALSEPRLRRTLFGVLRVKRSEREALLGRLPGVVRRGARVDLRPLEEALRSGGIPCTLRRRGQGEIPPP